MGANLKKFLSTSPTLACFSLLYKQRRILIFFFFKAPFNFTYYDISSTRVVVGGFFCLLINTSPMGDRFTLGFTNSKNITLFTLFKRINARSFFLLVFHNTTWSRITEFIFSVCKLVRRKVQ